MGNDIQLSFKHLGNFFILPPGNHLERNHIPLPNPDEPIGLDVGDLKNLDYWLRRFDGKGKDDLVFGDENADKKRIWLGEKRSRAALRVVTDQLIRLYIDLGANRQHYLPKLSGRPVEGLIFDIFSLMRTVEIFNTYIILQGGARLRALEA